MTRALLSTTWSPGGRGTGPAERLIITVMASGPSPRRTGYTFDPNSGNNTVTITFNATTARYVRLNITGDTGWPAGQLSEFQV